MPKPLQLPPRAVLTPRAVRARAMPRMLLTPLVWISLMIDRTLAANASRCLLRASMDARRTEASRGAPSLLAARLSGGKRRISRREARPPMDDATRSIHLGCQLSHADDRRNVGGAMIVGIGHGGLAFEHVHGSDLGDQKQPEEPRAEAAPRVQRSQQSPLELQVPVKLGRLPRTAKPACCCRVGDVAAKPQARAAIDPMLSSVRAKAIDRG